MLKKYTYYLSSIFTLLRHVRPLGLVVRMFLGYKPPQPVLVTLRPSGLRFYARSAMDIWSLKETLLDGFYEGYGFTVGDGWTVIDIGGGIGDFTIQAAQRHAQNRVLAFEPTPDSFDLLRRNLALNHITNVTAIPGGVWSSDNQIVIETAAGEAVQFTSHLADQAQPARVGQVQAPAYALETVFAQHSLTQCDLIKLDCEGAEYEILFNTPPPLLQRIRRIVMEYHDNAGPHTHADMARFLNEQGYRVRVTPSPVHAYLGYLSATR